MDPVGVKDLQDKRDAKFFIASLSVVNLLISSLYKNPGLTEEAVNTVCTQFVLPKKPQCS